MARDNCEVLGRKKVLVDMKGGREGRLSLFGAGLSVLLDGVVEGLG